MATSIEEAVRAWLVNDPAVGPLIGAVADASTGLKDGACWKASIPQAYQVPAGQGVIWYQVASDVRGRCLIGVNTDMEARLMLTLEAKDEATLSSLVQAIRGSPASPKLDGLTTQNLGFGSTTVWCQYAEIEDRPEDFVPERHSGDLGTFLTHLGLKVFYLSP